MSYEIERSERPAVALRRVTVEEATGAVASLADPEAPGEGIHDARKRLKKIRAVLRLARPHVGEALFDRENVAYRDAGRLLAQARQADVAVETVERLFDQALGDGIAPGPFRELRRRLVERRDAALASAFEAGGPAERARGRIERGAGRVGGWPLEGLDLAGMRGGLRRVYERGARGMEDAWAEETGAAFHEWRKRVKYLWCHLRLLGHAWPEVLEPLADVQHTLADLLGEANDLTDLILLLEGEPGLVEDDEARRALVALARGWRRDLWERARPHGVRLYAEDPDQFVSRLGAYWKGMKLERAGAPEG